MLKYDGPSMKPRGGFTLIEICLAVAIALVMLMIAVPSISGFLKQQESNQTFDALDRMVKKAQSLSLSERRAYLITLEKEQIILRPQAPENASEADGIDRIAISDKESYTLELPSALVKNPPAQWTFWPSGTREPAIIYYKGPSGAWTATFRPFSVKAEVTEL